MYTIVLQFETYLLWLKLKFLNCSDPLTNKYLVVLPKVLIGGSSEVVCITLAKMTAPINFLLELTLEDVVVFEMEYFMEFPYACLDLLVRNLLFMVLHFFPPSCKLCCGHYKLLTMYRTFSPIRRQYFMKLLKIAGRNFLEYSVFFHRYA